MKASLTQDEISKVHDSGGCQSTGEEAIAMTRNLFQS